MKKNFISLGLMLSAVITLTDCSKQVEQEAVETVVEKPVAKPKTPFKLIAGTGTKTTADGTAAGASISWVAGDAMAVFYAPAGTAEYSANNRFTIPEEGLASNTFTTDADISLTEAQYDWYAFYPYESHITTPANTGAGYVLVGNYKNSSQTQAGNDNKAAIAGSQVPLYGRVKSLPKEDTPSIQMHQALSFIEVAVKNTGTESLTVKEISFTAPEDIVGQYFIGFSGSAEDPVAFTARGNDYVSSTATLKVSDGDAIAQNGTAYFYLAVKPFSAGSGDELTISVNNYEKTITLTKDVSFTAGKIKKVGFTYDYTPPVFVPAEFELATSIAPGDEIIVASGTVGEVKVMKQYESGNNYKQVDATASSGKITSSEQMAILTVGMVDGAYTFLDARQGLYLNATGTTSDNHLKTSTTVDAYAKFSVSFSDDAAVVTCTGKNARNILRYNSGSSLFSCYTSGQQPVYIYKKAAASSGDGTITGISSAEVSASGAKLSASFTGVTTSPAPQNAGFRIGTTSSDLNLQTVYTTDLLDSADGSFTAGVSSLSPSKTYYYQAFMTVWDGSAYKEIVSEIKSFTTEAQGALAPAGWLELPALNGDEDFYGNFYGSGTRVGTNRNYSYNYSYSWYASLWVAYPLSGTHKSGSASTSSWNYNPDIDEARQVSVTSSSYGTVYNAGTYARGHQCPSASRKSDNTMNKQTYYVTNQTPQIQTKFNDGIWNALENAERSLVSSASDTVYVVTGPAYRKVGGSEEITYLSSTSGNPSSLAVPNYYWKAFLKVKWSGSGENRKVSSATAIAFWFEHKVYNDAQYTQYAVSVDQVEQWTGFDLFANLPDNLEASAESNASWDTFLSDANISSVSDDDWGSF